MTLISDLKSWGPMVTLALTILLLMKEMLNTSDRVPPLLHRGLTALIIPLLILFIVQIGLLVLTNS